MGVMVSTDPREAAVMTMTAYGLSVMGVTIGIYPELVLAGLWGAWWQLSNSAPMPFSKRISMAATASMVSAYTTPAIMSVIARSPGYDSASDTIRFPIAVAIGYLAHRYIGPMLSRIAKRKTEDLMK